MFLTRANVKKIVRNLRIYVISWSVCTWQAFPVYSNKHAILLQKFKLRTESFITYAPDISSQVKCLQLRPEPSRVKVLRYSNLGRATGLTRKQLTGNTKGASKYHCTIDLLFDWFGISCMTTDIFFNLQNRLIQYSDTSPFSIPCIK